MTIKITDKQTGNSRQMDLGTAAILFGLGAHSMLALSEDMQVFDAYYTYKKVSDD